MSAPQLKAYGLKHGGIKFKSTAKKEKMAAQLQNSWPFPETLEGFLGVSGPKGNFFFFKFIFSS
jgi:hypothetical protein